MYDEERAARELGKLLDGKQADISPEDADFAAELSQLAQHIQPDARFASALEARLRASSSTSSHPKVIKGDFRMAYTNRMRPLAIAAAALALAVLLTLTVPPLRSLAHDLFALLFNRASSDTQVFATPIVLQVIQATPVSEAVFAPSLTVEQVEAQAGFDVHTPAYLPPGYTLVNASYDPTAHLVSLLYSKDGVGLNIVQTPAIYAEPLDVGASAAIIPMQIGETTGQFVKGYWRPNTTSDGNSVSIEGQTWDPDLPFQQLRWQDDDRVYWMMDVFGQNDTLGLDEWKAIAESMR